MSCETGRSRPALLLFDTAADARSITVNLDRSPSKPNTTLAGESSFAATLLSAPSIRLATFHRHSIIGAARMSNLTGWRARSPRLRLWLAIPFAPDRRPAGIRWGASRRHDERPPSRRQGRAGLCRRKRRDQRCGVHALRRLRDGVCRECGGDQDESGKAHGRVANEERRMGSQWGAMRRSYDIVIFSPSQSATLSP